MEGTIQERRFELEAPKLFSVISLLIQTGSDVIVIVVQDSMNSTVNKLTDLKSCGYAYFPSRNPQWSTGGTRLNPFQHWPF